MSQRVELILTPQEAYQETNLLEKAAQKLRVPIQSIVHLKKVKRSIDARRNPVIVRFLVEVYTSNEALPLQEEFDFKEVSHATPVIVIGAGPAGLFAALKLIELGLKPIVLERGKAVRERRRDLAKINREGDVNPESNYCFGEGGAGTYSDGKLYTRSGKRGDIQRVLRLFEHHGASEEILYEAHPHIGTNKLPDIIVDMRKTIEHFGGEIHFNAKVVDLVIKDQAIVGVKLADGAQVDGRATLLCTGHSARDIFQLLQDKQVLLEAKPFSLGVRIEHPQALIDRVQYHCDDRGYLPPASYRLVHQVGSRGVFSFCMCPGGIIAPAATDKGEVVVNGWSPSKRNNPFANSGMVVNVELEDTQAFHTYGPLAAMHFQQIIEQKAYEAGGGKLVAPGQRMVDFIQRKASATLPNNSYHPGVTPAMLDDILPGFIAKSLRGGMQWFGQRMKGYLTNEAILVGVESRTSSPVRIPRDRETLMHPQISGLYPCGEGAGYAGGIVSAAMDGERCALQASKALH